MKKKNNKILYMLEDTKNNRLPLFVGTLDELVKYTGKTKNDILSAISHAKARGGNCCYIRLGTVSEIDNLEV